MAPTPPFRPLQVLAPPLPAPLPLAELPRRPPPLAERPPQVVPRLPVARRRQLGPPRPLPALAASAR